LEDGGWHFRVELFKGPIKEKEGEKEGGTELRSKKREGRGGRVRYGKE